MFAMKSKIIKKDGKKYREMNIGRGNTVWIELEPNKITAFIKSLFK
jgi:hypothetical protein